MKVSYLIDELDKILALVGVIFSLILTIWIKLVIGHPIYIIIGLLSFIMCIGYLIIRKFFYTSSITALDELKCSTRFYMTLNILFFLFLSYSIISIYLRPDTYIRPLGYFISTALMGVIIANEILFLSPGKSRIYFTLCKIIIIGLSLSYSQTLIFPSIVGIDAWQHQLLTLEIIDNGYIPKGLAYSKLPLMHLMIGMTSLVTDSVYKRATMFSISSLQVILDALFVFLLGKFLINTKVGLLAALLIELANYHINFGYMAVPNTMAATLILPIIFIILKLRRDKPFIGTSIVIFLMGILILTHTITAMCLTILLFMFWLSSEAYTRLFHQEIRHSVTWTICILFTTTMLAYWSYISGHIITLARFIEWGFQDHYLEAGYQYLSTIPLWEQLFKYLGMFLFFSISFIGCFYMMSKQFLKINRVITTIGGLMILCLAFFSIILGKYIIVGRWYYFSQILLAIPLSLSLLLLNGIFKHRFIKGLLMSLSVFILSFLLIISPAANIDNRLFSQNTGIRLAFTESELQAMETISEIWNGSIAADWYYHLPYKYNIERDIRFVYIDYLLDAGDFSDLQNKVIIVREEILKYPYHITRGTFKLKYDLHATLDQQNFFQIYDCGSASGYFKH